MQVCSDSKESIKFWKIKKESKNFKKTLKIFLMVLKKSKGFQKIPYDSEQILERFFIFFRNSWKSWGVLKILKNSKRIQINSKILRKFNNILEGSKRIQRIPKDSEIFILVDSPRFGKNLKDSEEFLKILRLLNDL